MDADLRWSYMCLLVIPPKDGIETWVMTQFFFSYPKMKKWTHLDTYSITHEVLHSVHTNYSLKEEYDSQMSKTTCNIRSWFPMPTSIPDKLCSPIGPKTGHSKYRCKQVIILSWKRKNELTMSCHGYLTTMAQANYRIAITIPQFPGEQSMGFDHIPHELKDEVRVTPN